MLQRFIKSSGEQGMYWKRDNAKGWMDFGKKKIHQPCEEIPQNRGFPKGEK